MSSDDVNARILVRLWDVAEHSRRRVEEPLHMRADCTVRQFVILDLIERTVENVTAANLARTLSCSRANVTQLLREMRQHGWLTVTPAYGDARAEILRITENGRLSHRSTGHLLADEAYAELEDLEVEEKQRLVTVLGRLARSRR
jgi:DNA-binding MarR family transcriptional regulator